MKIRSGFVSNSSSSSFVISTYYLSRQQISLIKNHIISCADFEYPHGDRDWYIGPHCEWDIRVLKPEDSKYDELHGSTHMDNFCMSTFMEVIGVDMSRVEFSR